MITLMIFVILALLALLKSPKIGRNFGLKHGNGNYFELLYLSLVILRLLNIFGEKNFFSDLVKLRFFAFLRSYGYVGCRDYTDEK